MAFRKFIILLTTSTFLASCSSTGSAVLRKYTEKELTGMGSDRR